MVDEKKILKKVSRGRMESAPDVEYWIIIFDLFHAFHGNGKEMF